MSAWLSDDAPMAMTLTETAEMAARACEHLAVSIRSGAVVVTKLSLVDEERTVLVIEALPVDEGAAHPAPPPRATATTVGGLLACPVCKAEEAFCRDLGRGDVICMKCNYNWNTA